MSFIPNVLFGGLLLLSVCTTAPSAENSHGGAVMQGSDSIQQNPSLPKLDLNTAQREQVRKVLLTKHTSLG